jgi:hypothetical protein
METLHIDGTKSTPDILFDHVTGVLSMSGESYPENSYEFYKPVLSWISRFLTVHDGQVTFNVHLSYLNTGSTKCMMDILDLLEESFLIGKNIAVNWYCDHENDRALETAEEFREEISLPFHITPVSEES